MHLFILRKVFHLLYIYKMSFHFHLVELGLLVLPLDDIPSDLIPPDDPKVSSQINTFSFPFLQYFRFVSWPKLFISFFLFSFSASSFSQLPLHYPPHKICQLSPGNLSILKNIITLATELRQELINSVSD